MDNHYAVLNVAMDAPESVIRAAYRVLAAQFHPDRHARNPAMLQCMQQVTAAYRVLSDARLRAEHDAQLQRARRRRASDGGRPPAALGAPMGRLEDAALECRRSLARRRAVVAAEYARHALLG